MQKTSMIAKKLQIRMEILINKVLYMIFKFDKWHIKNGWYSRAYKREVVNQINALGNDICVVVEIGCGLGDIIRNVKAPIKIGCDIDPKVILGAKLRAIIDDIDFRFGDWHAVNEKSIDVVIFVNWIHNLEPDQISELCWFFLSRTRYIVFDVLDLEALPSYKYSHDFDFLIGYAAPVVQFRCPGEPRTFHIWGKV